MSRRGSHSAAVGYPPPAVDADAGLDVLDLDDIGMREFMPTVGQGIDANGLRTSASTTAGAMRRRPGIDDEDERDTDPDGWVMPEWD